MYNGSLVWSVVASVVSLAYTLYTWVKLTQRWKRQDELLDQMEKRSNRPLFK